MSEKTWKFEEFIKLSRLRSLMMEFQLATDVEVSLFDDDFNLIFGRFPARKVCSYLVESAGGEDSCCNVKNDTFSLRDFDYSIVKCRMGLSYFVIPLRTPNSSPVGYIISEPFFLEKSEKQDFLSRIKSQRDRKLSVSFDEMRELLREVEVIPEEIYRAKASFLLHAVATLIQTSVQKDEIKEKSSLLAENHRLREKAEERVKSLLTLFEISKNISTITDLDQLFTGIIKSISKFMNVETCSIMLMNRHTRHLEVASSLTVDEVIESINSGETAAAAARREVADYIPCYVAQSGNSILIEDISRDERFLRKLSGSPANRYKSSIVVPLKFKDEVIGVLSIGNKKPSVFNVDDKILLESIADQTAIAIMNATLYAESSGKLERLSVLNRVSNIVNSTLELNKVLSMTISLITDVMKVETCSLMLMTPDEKSLKIVVAHGLDDRIIKNADIMVGEGISGLVAKTGKPLLITDISKDRRFSRRPKSSVDYKTKSALSVPLIIKDRVIGVINVNNKSSQEVFTTDDLQMLETLATQIASAIDNAKLYNQMQQRVVELIMLHNLSLALNSSLDLKNIISQIIGNMRSIFDADIVSLMLWDEKREHLTIISQSGLPENYSALKFRAGEGIAGMVAQKGEPVLVQNTLAESTYKKYDRKVDESPKTLICAPIIVKNVVEGVISCEKWLDFTGPFNEDNLNLLTTIACHAAIAFENANLYNDLLRVYLETVQSLAAALDAKDSYTHGHSRRVTALALALAAEMKFSDNELNTLKHAALLHDIGKIGIAESILQKPSSLTDAEFTCIKNHPVTGARILESVEFLKSVCMQIKHHHERFDGRGYPDGLSGVDIPLGSRVIAIADTYDAMTSTRPYRQGLSHEFAVEELRRCSGTQFDPEVVNAFLAISDVCKKISENGEQSNIINISGIKAMLDGSMRPMSLF